MALMASIAGCTPKLATEEEDNVTPKDNERNDHREKSDDESELRLGM